MLMEEIVFKFLTWLGSPIIAGLFTIGLCCFFGYRSWQNKKNGIIDDGAQQAVTIGVTFTFIGIIAALWDFNVTDVDNIKQTITQFLNGMKTAFITSIIGIISSILIKIFIQGSIERQAQENQKIYSVDILRLLANLQELLKNNIRIQNDIADNTDTMAKNSTAATTITESIQSLKESIDKSSSGALERAVDNLSDKMDKYIRTSQDTNGIIQNVAEQLFAQTKGIDALGVSLQKSNQEQITAIDALGNILKESGKNQVSAVNQLGEKLNEMLKISGTEQIVAVQNLGNMLSEIFKTSGQEQTQRLDSMNGLIATMLNYSEQTYNNSVIALNESRDYQKDSLEISRKQQEILSDNTDRITEMKVAFNKFLDDMAKKNNEEFIKALNESMKDLNQRLTEQFGDNFKQLNEAVIKLKDWQEDYQDVIEATTDELIELNDTFRKFSMDIAPKVAENAERLQKSVDIFNGTSEKNIAVQEGLNEATQRLIESISNSEKVAENLKTIHEGLTDYQEKFLNSLEKSFKDHQKKTVETMQATSDKLSEIAAKQEGYTESIAKHQENILDTLEKQFKEYQDKNFTTIEETFQKMTETVENTTRKITSQMQVTEETFESIIANQNTYSEKLKNEMKNFVTEYQNSILESMQGVADRFAEIVAQVQSSAEDAVKDTLSMFNEIMRQQQKDAAEQMKYTANTLSDIAKQNQATVENSLDNVKKSVEKMNDSILNVAINATDSIKQFEGSSKQILDKIGLALDGFNTDFQIELEKAMKELKTNLETMLNKNSEVARKNSEELAAILATVTEKMVKEYQKLADHISDIDREIFERRAS